jgi:hypothetical protein
MNTIYSIVTPTVLQADRLSDGTIEAHVSVRNHAPSHAFISLEDYLNHDIAGFISIKSIAYGLMGRCTIRYSVN